MSLFAPKTNAAANSRLLGLRVSTSIYGSVIPTSRGRVRRPGNLIWLGDWTSAPVKNGGKGGGKGSGGGKGGGQYTYSASFIHAIGTGGASLVRVFQDKTTLTTLPHFSDGSQGQSVWGFLASKHPGGEALGYSEICHADFSNFDLGTAGTIPNLTYEIDAGGAFGSGIVDELVSDSIYFLLTDRNVGGIDPAALGPLTEVRNYCLANGLFISPELDQQQPFAEYLREYLMIGNCEIVSSEGLLKFRTYGDTAASSTYGTFVPDTAPLYDLDYEDFLGSADAPITFSLDPAQDADNQISIEWMNRDRDYNVETLPDEDFDAIRKYGLNAASAITAHSIKMRSVAAKVASVQIKRRVHILRKCAFRLSWKHSLLEPMDIVSVPEQYPSTARVAVRLLSIDEDEDGALTCTGEVLPFPISAPTVHPKPGAGGYTPGFGATPSATNKPIFFEVTPDMTNLNFAAPLTLLIALSGGPSWGGCGVHVSKDGGASYEYVGRQDAASTMGFSTAGLAYGADPDSTHTLSVNLQESLGTLASVDQTVADKFQSLLVLDDELLAYETATLTGSNRYDLTYLRRGVYGTFAVPHASNAPFATLDGSQFEFELQPGDVGKTFWFKFPAFNRAGQQEQDIAAAVAYPFTVRASQSRLPLPPQPNAAFDLNQSLGVLGTSPGMRLRQVNTPNANGSVDTGIGVSFIPPVNTPSKTVKSPGIASVSVISSGGSIAAGTYLIALEGGDSDGGRTDWAVTQVVVPSGSSQIVITPAWGAGNFEYRVYSCKNIDQLTFATGFVGSPGTITLTSLNEFTSGGLGFGGPLDAVYDHMQITAFAIAHGGVWGDVATSYSGFDIEFTSAAFTVNQFAGYKLVLYSQRATGIFAQFTVTILSNTATTVTTDTDFTDLIGSVLPAGSPSGDVWVCRMKPTSVTATGFSEPNLVNSYSPSGLNANQDVGTIVIAVRGTGAGQIFSRVKSNTATDYEIEGTWAVTPDATTEFVFIYPVPIGAAATAGGQTDGAESVVDSGTLTLGASSYDYPIYADLGIVPIPNQTGISVLIVAQAADADGNLSEFELSPMQEAYLFAQPGTSSASADGEYSMPLVKVTPTLSGAIDDVQITCTLSSATGLPSGPFVALFASGEWCRITARAGTSVTAMDRGYNGTTAAAQSSGSDVVIVTATPDLAQGAAQRIDTVDAPVNLLDPANAMTKMWALDIAQDTSVTGWADSPVDGWMVYPSGSYAGFEDGGSADPRKWDLSKDKRYVVQMRTRADGTTVPAGGNGGPYSLT